MANIDRNTYEKFIKKILSLKLESINIDLFNDEHDVLYYDKDIDEDLKRFFHTHIYDNSDNSDNYDNYSLEELKKINKNILCLNYEKIKIKKYPIENNSKIKKD